MRVYSESPTAVTSQPARSPIGHWFKLPVRADSDTSTAILAACLPAYTDAVARAVAIVTIHRVIVWAHDRQRADVRGIASEVLAATVGWPGDAETFTADLSRAGVIDDAGQIRNFAYVTGVREPAEDRLRRMNRDRVSRFRARQKAVAVTPIITNHYMVMVGNDVSGDAYNERARDAHGETLETHTYSGRTSFDRETATAMGPLPVTDWPEAAHRIVATFPDWAPSARVRRRVGVIIGDAPERLEAWADTLGQWHDAGWHPGNRAIDAILDRFSKVIDGTLPTRPKPKGRPRSAPMPSGAVARTSPGTPPATQLPEPLSGDALARSQRALAQMIAENRARFGRAPVAAMPAPAPVPIRTGIGISLAQMVQTGLIKPPPSQHMQHSDTTLSAQ